MCPDPKPFEIVKQFTDLAAPIITICSALLGLFTQTHIEKSKYKSGKEIITKQLTLWAWVAMTGIIIGGVISVWSILNDYKLKEINTCIDRAKDKVQQAKIDSIFNKGIELTDELRTSIEISNKIADTGRQSLNLLIKTNYTQNLALNKQDSLNAKTEQILNPFTPFNIKLDINFKYDSSYSGSTTNGFFAIQKTCMNLLQNYVGLNSVNKEMIKGLRIEHGSLQVNKDFNGYVPLKSKDVKFLFSINNSRFIPVFDAISPGRRIRENENIDYDLTYLIDSKSFFVTFYFNDFETNDYRGEIRSSSDFLKYQAGVSLTMTGWPSSASIAWCDIYCPPIFSKVFRGEVVKEENYSILNILGAHLKFTALN